MMSNIKREFQEFWIQTAGKVRAYMFCACENWTDADDMTQDCYLRALRAWGQFDGRASRQAWLFGIARRTRVDWFRRKKREELVVHSENMDEFDKVDTSGSKGDRFERIWDAVKDLNAEHRQVIHMRFAAGLSYAQIAHALEIPIGTVRSRLHRGLKQIRECIGDYDNEP
ncbi:MAG: sigma-70 family RNA polymerase sigma factor [Sedimentisphaerales bacterium]|nr:sigma-70 family RNA polymerase sigma factor [Sedimentisphaerales bacterium]